MINYHINKIALLFLLMFAVTVTGNAQNGNGGEEDRYELVDIDFEGNNTLSSTLLRSVLISQETPDWFSKFLNSFSSLGDPPVYFDSLVIPTDINQIEDVYINNGFFKAEVSHRYELDTADMDARLVYEIQENAPATFDTAEVMGIDSLRREFRYDIREFAKVDTTERYRLSIVERMQDDIFNYLRDRGFMLVQLETPEAKIDTFANKVVVVLNVDTGNRYMIDEVRVNRTGDTRELVKDELIRDIVDVDSGDYYSYIELNQAQVRLYRTGLFSAASVTGVVADTSGNKVPVNVTADVGLLHELSPEIILNNEDNTLNTGIGLSFTKKNFLGNARKLRTGASTAAQDITEFLGNPSINDTTIFGYADARISIEQPFLFGYPINTIWENYITLQKRRNEYNTTLVGSKLSFTFELPPYVYFTGLQTYVNWEYSKYLYRYEYMNNILTDAYVRNGETTNTADSLSNDVLAGSDLETENTNAVLGVALNANRTNDLLFPTRGYSTSLVVEDGNSISTFFTKVAGGDLNEPQYYKVLLTTSVYLPLYSSHENAFALKFRAGHIQAYSGGEYEIPSNRRFFAGGSNSIRGWQARELTATDDYDIPDLVGSSPQAVEDVLINGAAPGGFFLLEGSIETRNRLFGKIGGALFVDYGNVWNGYDDFNFDEIAVAAGFGFRYYSQYVPIRFDFGFKVYDPQNRRSMFAKQFFDVMQFHLGIGEAF